MNILITSPRDPNRDIYFPKEALSELKKLGNVVLNTSVDPYSEADLKESIKNIDICITHWDTPLFTNEVVENADRLKLIAHAAGSVANLVSEEVYRKGIVVCSANDIMAGYVAEGVLCYILAGLRLILEHSEDMKNGIWKRKVAESKTLFDAKIGFVGLGTVGRRLLDLLVPFHTKVKIFDPYLSPDAIRQYPNVELASLEETLAWGNIITVHASLTQETYHLISKQRLTFIQDDALFVNTSRGLIIDEDAIYDELACGRLSAVLDVFTNEPLEPCSRLRGLKNVILMPHMAGAPAREQMTFGIIEEVGRFIRGEALKYAIPYEKYKLMTKE